MLSLEMGGGSNRAKTDNTALYKWELAKNVHHNSFVGDKKPNVCVTQLRFAPKCSKNK